MATLYQCDLAYIHAAAFETIALGAAPAIVRRLQSSNVPIRKVIDLGCGAGPLTKSLVNAGFDVTGVDTSDALLQLARVRVPEARFIRASIYDTDIRDHDAIVAVGEPLTYHPQEADADHLVATFIQRAAKALPPGGLLIFDVIGLGEPSLAGRNWSSAEDWAVLVETTENHAARTLVRNIEIFRRIREAYRRSHEVHQVRLFDVSVLRDQLSVNGFAVEVSPSYGALRLPPRRHALFATRLAAARPGLC